jgi:hypothetical protein
MNEVARWIGFLGLFGLVAYILYLATIDVMVRAPIQTYLISGLLTLALAVLVLFGHIRNKSIDKKRESLGFILFSLVLTYVVISWSLAFIYDLLVGFSSGDNCYVDPKIDGYDVICPDSDSIWP